MKQGCFIRAPMDGFTACPEGRYCAPLAGHNVNGPSPLPGMTKKGGSYRTCRSESRPISRVLSWAIIHLGLLSPASSSDLPEDTAGHDIVFLFGLAPGGVYQATNCYQLRGALLPHHFTLTCPTNKSVAGGIFSVALSVGSRPPGVT